MQKKRINIRPRVFAPAAPAEGAVAIELAIVFPVVMLLFMGLFDVSRALHAYWKLSTVVEHGLRVSAYYWYIEADNTAHTDSYLTNSPAGHARMQGVVADLLTWENPPLIGISITTTRNNNDFTMTVSGSYDPMFPVIPNITISAGGVSETFG